MLFRSSRHFDLFCDPCVGAGFEHIEGQSSAVEHLVMETAGVKLGAQFFLGVFAQFADLEQAQFLRESLRGYRDIAVGFGLDRGLVDSA